MATRKKVPGFSLVQVPRALLLAAALLLSGGAFAKVGKTPVANPIPTPKKGGNCCKTLVFNGKCVVGSGPSLGRECGGEGSGYVQPIFFWNGSAECPRKEEFKPNCYGGAHVLGQACSVTTTFSDGMKTEDECMRRNH